MYKKNCEVKAMISSKLVKMGAKIKYYRKLKGINQKELAAKLEISPQYLSKIESGKQTPSMRVLIRMSEILCIEVAALVSDSNV